MHASKSPTCDDGSIVVGGGGLSTDPSRMRLTDAVGCTGASCHKSELT